MKDRSAGRPYRGEALSPTDQAEFIERTFAEDFAASAAGEDVGERPGLLGAWIAQKYFIEKKLKREIAEELGISRFRVARLIRASIADGTVRIQIEIRNPEGIEGELSSRLQHAFGLRRVVVVTAHPDPASTMRAVAKAAAAVVAETLEPNDVLGISWGRALNAMVDLLPPLPPCPIVQMAGGSSDWDLSVNAVDLVRRAGTRTGAKVYALHAPLAVASPELARALRHDPAISQTLAMFPSVTKAVVGVGCWSPPGSTIRDILPEADRAVLEARGVVGDACGSFWTRDGEAVDTPLQERLIAFRESDLRAVPELIAVTHGRERASGIEAVLLAGFATTLVTDSEVAHQLLKHADGLQTVRSYLSGR
jgi:DNA-binding transcriptional regulator LsrR (DeoR family)